MLNLYVIANITRNEQEVFIYDERLMGKDKDALCSLRMSFHIEQRNRCLASGIEPPKVFISIRDNCVAQNKSNSTLKFEAFLSMTFYELVLIIYLIPGHSHMLPDRVVAWVKKSLKRLNLYSPHDIIKIINTINTVTGRFIDHQSNIRPTYSNWSQFLDKHIINLESGFTGDYVFEFKNGVVRQQHLISSTPKEFVLCKNAVSTSKAMKLELFGTVCIDHLNPNELKLPRMIVRTLDNKKVISLQKKYGSIPADKLSYFPCPIAVDDGEDNEDVGERLIKKKNDLSKRTKPLIAPGARVNLLGRPKSKAQSVTSGTKSILQYFFGSNVKLKVEPNGLTDDKKVSTGSPLLLADRMGLLAPATHASDECITGEPIASTKRSLETSKESAAKKSFNLINQPETAKEKSDEKLREFENSAVQGGMPPPKSYPDVFFGDFTPMGWQWWDNECCGDSFFLFLLTLRSVWFDAEDIAVFENEYPGYSILFNRVVNREISMKDAKYQWKLMRNLPKLNAAHYFGFDELLFKFEVTMAPKASRLFNNYVCVDFVCLNNACQQLPHSKVTENMMVTCSDFPTPCEKAFIDKVPLKKMTLERLLEPYALLMNSRIRRCRNCGAVCDKSYTVLLPKYLLVDINGMAQLKMNYGYTLTNIDREMTFQSKRYELVGVAYSVNKVHFISRFIDKTSDHQVLWEQDGMFSDDDGFRRGRCVQLSTDGKSSEEWFPCHPEPGQYKTIAASLAVYALIK